MDRAKIKVKRLLIKKEKDQRWKKSKKVKASERIVTKGRKADNLIDIYIYIYTRHHFLTIVMSRRIIRVNGATRKLSFVRDYYIKNLVDAISSSLKEFFN